VGKIGFPEPVKLFAGLIGNELPLIEAAQAALERRLGPIDFESGILDFNLTAYYSKEMGAGLKRKFVTFEKLIRVEKAAEVKILTNKIEEKFSTKHGRRVNIDPGYICLGKLVLLTTKDYYHRIYITKGIYAEVTLYYKDKSFRPFEWSYPDYKSENYIEFFNNARGKYFTQLRAPKC